MRCAKAVKQLQLYMDKQLTLGQLRALEAHISICSACHAELLVLEDIENAVQGMELVVEPADLTVNVMRRVALSAAQTREAAQKQPYELFRPSLRETLTAVLLATVAMLGIVLVQPSVRAVLPVTGSHGLLFHMLINFWNILIGVDSGTLMLILWVVGTILGVWITLMLAGAEVRTVWFKSVMDRLPVW